MTKAQANIRRILTTINKWGSEPLFSRKGGTTNLLLDISNRDLVLNTRLKKCIDAKRQIDHIVNDVNFRLFFNIDFSCPCSSDEEDDDEELHAASGMISQRAQTSSFNDEDVVKLRRDVNINLVKSAAQLAMYRAYLEYVDTVVGDELMAAIQKRFELFGFFPAIINNLCRISFGVSVHYIKLEMENGLEHNAPLFEILYEMQRPNVFFVPNLDSSSSTGFMAFIEELIIDIYSMSDMIPRIAQPPESERLNSHDGLPYVATYECM